MKFAVLSGVIVLALTALDGSAAGAPPDAAAPHWFDAVAGQKLVAVDGSTFLISQSDSGLSLQIASPGGDTRSLSFSFMTDELGSVMDADSSTKPIGVFRQTDSGIDAQFADGHSETFAANPSGGISMTMGGNAQSFCTDWYPQGHVFSEAERKAALAAYASRLGLAVPQKSAPRKNCADPAPARMAAHTPPYHFQIPADGAQTSAQAVVVRTSQVHPIDDPQPAAQQVAALPAPGATTTQRTSASSCLSIDSSGANWGFRNACAYDVQFAYCLMNGQDKSTACGTGSGSGNVAANSFFSLLPNNAIVTADQEFRWIGCTGNANEVTAHLDRTDPPAGRCVALRAS